MTSRGGVCRAAEAQGRFTENMIAKNIWESKCRKGIRLYHRCNAPNTEFCAMIETNKKEAERMQGGEKTGFHMEKDPCRRDE